MSDMSDDFREHCHVFGICSWNLQTVGRSVFWGVRIRQMFVTIGLGKGLFGALTLYKCWWTSKNILQCSLNHHNNIYFQENPFCHERLHLLISTGNRKNITHQDRALTFRWRDTVTNPFSQWQHSFHSESCSAIGCKGCDRASKTGPPALMWVWFKAVAWHQDI